MYSKNNHTWDTSFGNIKAGNWCEICYGRGTSERICREYFIHLFNADFPPKYVKWIINEETGRPLQLDGYNEELGIAFEYQGAQHYLPRYFNKKNDLDKRQAKDQLKKKKCIENNVKLIEVPYTITNEDMGAFIIKACRDAGIEFQEPGLAYYDYKSFNINKPDKLAALQEICKRKGGKCLSDVYVDCITPLEFDCGKGHTWIKAPRYIEKGQWCSYCSGKRIWRV